MGELWEVLSSRGNAARSLAVVYVGYMLDELWYCDQLRHACDNQAQGQPKDATEYKLKDVEYLRVCSPYQPGYCMAVQTVSNDL